MRLFVAIELPDAIKDAAARTADDLRGQLATAAPSAVLRWVAPSNLHITLWFLGEVDDTRAATLDALLSTPFETPAFELRAYGAGMFPPTGAPRALWIGLTDGAPSLVAVYNELTPRLAHLGFEPERRPYSPHVTIARFKDIHRKDVAAARRVATQCTQDVGTCRISAVTLFRSRLSPTSLRQGYGGPPELQRRRKGSQYEPLFRVPLS